MTTTAELLTRVGHDYLLGGGRERRNVLKTSINSSATTIELTYELKGIAEGSVISIDLESMYVVDVNAGAQTATVQRSESGTPPTAHTAGTAVNVNPRYQPGIILRQLNAELDALSAEGLYQMKQTTLTYTSGVDGYDLGDSSAIDVWDVRADTPGSEKDWPFVPFTWQNGLPTTGTHAFASGVAVFPDWGEPGRSLRVWYKAPFSHLSSASDVVETTAGIHTEAVDLLCIGAAVRMVAGHAVRRARPDAQGDTRRGEEVTVNDSLQSVRALLALRDTRLKAEIGRLRRMYPARLRTR